MVFKDFQDYVFIMLVLVMFFHRTRLRIIFFSLFQCWSSLTNVFIYICLCKRVFKTIMTTYGLLHIILRGVGCFFYLQVFKKLFIFNFNSVLGSMHGKLLVMMFLRIFSSVIVVMKMSSMIYLLFFFVFLLFIFFSRHLLICVFILVTLDSLLTIISLF